MAPRWHKGRAPPSALWSALTADVQTEGRKVLADLSSVWQKDDRNHLESPLTSLSHPSCTSQHCFVLPVTPHTHGICESGQQVWHPTWKCLPKRMTLRIQAARWKRVRSGVCAPREQHLASLPRCLTPVRLGSVTSSVRWVWRRWPLSIFPLRILRFSFRMQGISNLGMTICL